MIINILTKKQYSIFSKAFIIFFTIFFISLNCKAADSSFINSPVKCTQNKRKLIKILSIDGGGIRGIIPAVILMSLEKRLKNGKTLAESFHIIAGTSTGGLIALLLNVPDERGKPKYTAHEIYCLYKTLGRTVFYQSLLHKILSLNGWLDEKYSSENLHHFMLKYIGDIRLRHSVTNIIVPAYDIINNRVKFFRKTQAQMDIGKDFLMRDIGRATSAAPTYFQPAAIKSINGLSFTFVDGGVSVNNPAISACVYAVELYGKDNDFLIVSLGTGTDYDPNNPEFEEKATSFMGGKLYWADKIVNLLMYASSDAIHYQLLKLFNGGGKYYYRFQPTISKENSDLDDTSEENILELEKQALKLTSVYEEDLNRIAELLNNEYLDLPTKVQHKDRHP